MTALATRMPWTAIEAALAPAFAHKDRQGEVIDGADLFGATSKLVGAGVSARGRRRLPIRLMYQTVDAVRMAAQHVECWQSTSAAIAGQHAWFDPNFAGPTHYDIVLL